ncbi:MAG TPA: DHH family phosphoesterase, partial [Thermoprotei archaeon]|nr:DHH family phosphoesterase [Thermoprotei archaeon]
MSTVSSKFNTFKKHIETITTIIKDKVSQNPVLIVSHYDADGLTSAAILLDLLLHKGISFHLKIVEQIDRDLITFLKETKYPYIILLDLGSGTLKILSQIEKEIFILDHHHPSVYKETVGKIRILNPHLLGIDGSTEISTSGITYFLAKNMDESKSDKYIVPAIIGALGDRQDIGPHFRLIGLNEIIVKEGLEKGIIKAKIGLRLYGLTRHPLVKALEYTMDPFIPGLSGDENACLLFFKKIGISPVKNNKLRYFSSLSREEVKKLATELIKYAISKGVSVKDAERLFGMKYYILLEEENTMFYDARDYSIVINACGRMERYDLAILLLNNYISREEIFNKVLEVVKEYRKNIAQFLEK